MTERLSIPASGGGLVRYFDESETKIKLKPRTVVLMIIGIIAFAIILRVLS